ncbi:hypothetical protein HDU82_006225, partial [Entophlyctis luteolus]
ARVTGLLGDYGRKVNGVRFSDSNTQQCHELFSDSVVLATGGYAADSENSESFIHKYVPEYAHLATTNGKWATGDGVKIGLEFGAAAVDLDKVQVHPTGFVDPNDANSSVKILAPEALRAYGGLLIDLNTSRRFVNELTTRDVLSKAMFDTIPANRERRNSNIPLIPPTCLLVMNEHVSSSFGSAAFSFYQKRGVVQKFLSLHFLAEKYGLDESVLETQICRKDAGEIDEFGKSIFPAVFSNSAVVYAALVTPVRHFTMGGLKINANAQVLNRRGEPIEGLFSCGEVAGGIDGSNRLAGNSLLGSVVFGRVAGRSCCSNASRSEMTTLDLATASDHINVTTVESPQEVANESEHALFIRAILMLSLILLSMNVNGMLHKIKFHYLSETAVTIILGVVAALAWTTISYDSTNADIQLNSDFFYMVLLPPIIFEGGYTLQRVSFFYNIHTILSLAFAGALFSTFVCSALMYLFSQWIYPWTFIESLVFGSLISSTDPVTVLSLLPSSVDRRLYMIIFGESALNDAVAIILYRFFTGFADPTAKLGIGPFITSVFASAAVFFGSFLVGIFIALIFAKITKHFKIEEGSVYEVTMLILFAYISYLLADVLGLTGIISIFFCGIAMAHYAAGNLSEEARKASKVTLRLLAFVCETFIFLYLGLGLLSFGSKASYDPLMIIFACVAILVSRTHVFVILGIKNLLLKHQAKDALHPEATTSPVPMNQQILIWFSGLRGAVAFALGVTFLEQDAFTEEAKASIFGTTVMVVVLTVLVIGGLTPYMLVWLGICEGEHDEESGQQEKDLQQLDAEHGKEHSAEDNDGDDQEFDEEEFNRNAESKSVFVWLRNLDDKTTEAVDTFVPKALFPRASLPPELEPKRKSTVRMSESYRSLKKKSIDMGLDGDLGLSGTSDVQKTAETTVEMESTKEEKKFMIE